MKAITINPAPNAMKILPTPIQSFLEMSSQEISSGFILWCEADWFISKICGFLKAMARI